ncbi:MAG: hypothetical protein IPJ24_01785 [bacterium]|nr:hypothetical protein [bacterium]
MDGRNVAYTGSPEDDDFRRVLEALVAEKGIEPHMLVALNEHDAWNQLTEAFDLAGDGELQEAMVLVDDTARQFAAIDPAYFDSVRVGLLGDYLEGRDDASVRTLGARLLDGSAAGTPAVLGNLAWFLVAPERGHELPDLALATRIAERAVDLSGAHDAFLLAVLARCQWLADGRAQALATLATALSLVDDGSDMQRELQVMLDEYGR